MSAGSSSGTTVTVYAADYAASNHDADHTCDDRTGHHKQLGTLGTEQLCG